LLIKTTKKYQNKNPYPRRNFSRKMAKKIASELWSIRVPMKFMIVMYRKSYGMKNSKMIIYKII
jgi:hypothetical protein